jgi:c-di-GMP-binding flagellar brake protein YcgR
MDAPAERRRFPRLATAVGAKVYDERARRYRPARTVDVSAGGLLLEVAGGAALHPGDRLDIALNFDDRLPVVRKEDLLPAIVVRTADSHAASRTVGLRFIEPQALQLAA